MLSDKVIEQILAIRQTGETNMFDVSYIKKIALREGYFELLEFIEEDTPEYARFILTGEK